MAQYSNGKRVLHKYIGSTQTFSDDTIWEELKLPAGSTGHVFAQVDLANKNVSLFGRIHPQVLSASNTTVLIPAQNTLKFSVPKTEIRYINDYTSGNSEQSSYFSANTNGDLIAASEFASDQKYTVFFFNKSMVNTQDDYMTPFVSDLAPVTLPITIN